MNIKYEQENHGMYYLSWGICTMAAMEEMQKSKNKIGISGTLIASITDKQNSASKDMFYGEKWDENSGKLSTNYQKLKIHDGRQSWQTNRSWYQINWYVIFNSALNLPKNTVVDPYMCLYKKLGC